LNVYAPPSLDVAFQRVPVMVWFHGGAFQYGESDDFNPTALVKKGIVVVTVNYRLGALGFMAHPTLTAESSEHGSGNYGLMDQQAALRWVQRNIRSFGGDNTKVTIFGESAGGVSVYAHLSSPDSAGLFHRAIAQSGSYIGSQNDRTLAEAEAAGQAYAAAVGCGSQTLACLRAVPVATLLANQSTSPVAYLPNTDPGVLPEGLYSAIYYGHFNKVPVLHGATQDEGTLFVALRELAGFPTNSRQTYIDNFLAVWGQDTGISIAMVDIFYTAAMYGGEANALSAWGSNHVFSCPAVGLSHYIDVASPLPVYHYEFDDQNAPQEVLPAVSFPYGAYHGSDVQYLLDSSDGPAPFSTAQKALAEQMKNYWVNFARNGNPNGGSLPAWPAYFDAPVPNNASSPSMYMELSLNSHPFNSLEFMTDHGCFLFGPPYTN
jgi:para-nitrobenzyl esterase